MIFEVTIPKETYVAVNPVEGDIQLKALLNFPTEQEACMVIARKGYDVSAPFDGLVFNFS